MVSKRRVTQSKERNQVFQYLKRHPQELRYIVGDYLACNGLMAIKNPKIITPKKTGRKLWMTQKNVKE